MHTLTNCKTQLHIRYTSQETLKNPRIHRVGNPQFFRGIVEDIRGIVKGCPWNHRRVSAESLKGSMESPFVEGHQHSQNHTVFLE